MIDKTLNYSEIKIDSLISIFIFQDSLFYEEFEASDNLIEYEIPLASIKKITYHEKRMSSGYNGCNLLFNIFNFSDDYQVPYEEDYSNRIEENQYILIEYLLSKREEVKFLKVYGKLLTKDKFLEIKKLIQK